MHLHTGLRQTPVVSYSTAAAHLRLADDGEKPYVLDLIEDATSYAEAETESTLGTRTLTATFHAGEDIDLPCGPVQRVQCVTDAAGLDVSYRRETIGHRERLILTGPATFPVTVVYAAGHNPCPGALRRCILAHIADCYDTRAPARDKPPATWIERTYAHYRRTPHVS